MATKKYEIETLESVATWTVTVITKIFKLIEKEKKGKKVTGWDALGFIKPLFDLLKIVGEYKKLGKEWLDLDESEKELLNLIVKENLDIEEAKAKEISERIFFILMEIGDFVSDMAVNK